MTLEEKINLIANAKFTKINGPIEKVYCLDDDKFDPNTFCNVIERAFHHRGEDVLEALKFCVLGEPTRVKDWYRSEIINDIIKFDNLLLANKNMRYTI